MAWLKWGDFYVDDASGQSYGAANVPEQVRTAARDVGGGQQSGPVYPGSNRAFSSATTAIERELMGSGMGRADVNRIFAPLGRIAYGAGATGLYDPVNLSAQDRQTLGSVLDLLPPEMQAPVMQLLAGGGQMAGTTPAESFYGDLLPGILDGSITGPLTRGADGALRQVDAGAGATNTVVPISPNRNSPPPGALPPDPTKPWSDPDNAPGSDPYAAFKRAYDASPQAAVYGPLDQAKLSNVAFLSQLPNELYRLLPVETLASLAPDTRFLQLPNEDVIRIARYNPNVLGYIPPDRFKMMPRDYVEKEVLPYLDKQDANMAARIRTATGITAPPQPGSGTGAPPSPDAPTNQNPPASPTPGSNLPGALNVQPLQNGQFGQLPDFSNLSDLSLDYYFPFGINDPFAVENYLMGAGINPNTGNPFGEFLGAQVPGQALLASDFNTLRGQPANTRGILGSLNNFFGPEGGMFPTGEQSGQFLGDLNTLISDFTGGGLKTLAEQSRARIRAANPGISDKDLEAKFMADPVIAKALLASDYVENPGRGFDTLVNANRGNISPFLRNNRRLMSSLQDRLYSDFMRSAPSQPNKTWFSTLLGV